VATRSYAILEISWEAYSEIRAALVAAGYEGQFHDKGLGEFIDMNGIAVKGKPLVVPRFPGSQVVGVHYERGNDDGPP